MEQRKYKVFAGVDWATTEHQVCVLLGEERWDRKFEHSGAGLTAMADWLLELGDGDSAAVAVGIEIPRGPVVETLLERGFAVYALNPKQLDRFRDRFSVAGAKSDELDAYVAASSLRTDLHLFRPAKLDDAVIVQLREASRTHDELKEQGRALSNRLRDLLLRYFPSLLTLSPAADDEWLWSLLQLAPTPDIASKLRERTLEVLLKKHRISRLDSAELHRTLAEKPVYVAAGVAVAVSRHAKSLIPQLRLNLKQQKECDRLVKQLVMQLHATPETESTKETEPGQQKKHRDADIVLSMPGIGHQNAAAMFAEATQPLANRDYDELRLLSGCAPVSRGTGKRSGKHAHVNMRRACNARLRNAFYHWGRVAMQYDKHTRQHYATLRAKGHGHARAIRGVVDRLAAVLIAMLKAGTLYDPTRRGLQPAAPTAA